MGDIAVETPVPDPKLFADNPAFPTCRDGAAFPALDEPSAKPVAITKPRTVLLPRHRADPLTQCAVAALRASGWMAELKRTYPRAGWFYLVRNSASWPSDCAKMGISWDPSPIVRIGSYEQIFAAEAHVIMACTDAQAVEDRLKDRLEDYRLLHRIRARPDQYEEEVHDVVGVDNRKEWLSIDDDTFLAHLYSVVELDRTQLSRGLLVHRLRQ